MHKVISSQVGKSRAIRASEDRATLELNSNEYLFSQNTIVSSVALERDGVMIKPVTSRFVNTNGDAWANPSLKANYPSFRGAWNFVNHEQVPEKAVGFIADAALRRILLDPKTATHVYYTDILTCTHRDHGALCKGLLNDEIKFMSMGCDAMISRCSQCGEVFKDDEDMCDCLMFNKGKTFLDKSGKQRKIAELLGDKNPGSVVFIEASWLTEVPAFQGACRRNLLKVPKNSIVSVETDSTVLGKDAVKKYLGL